MGILEYCSQLWYLTSIRKLDKYWSFLLLWSHVPCNVWHSFIQMILILQIISIVRIPLFMNEVKLVYLALGLILTFIASYFYLLWSISVVELYYISLAACNLMILTCSKLGNFSLYTFKLDPVIRNRSLHNFVVKCMKRTNEHLKP